MRNHNIAAPFASGLALLCALAAPAHARQGAPELRVEPVMNVRHSEMGLADWYRLGRFHQERKRYDMAAEAYLQVLAHDPAHAEARNALATVYATQGRFEEAFAEFEILTGKEPRQAHVYNNLGYAHFLKADYLQAAAAFGKAISIDPRNARAFANLVRAYEQLGLGVPERAQRAAMAAMQSFEARKDDAQPAPAVTKAGPRAAAAEPAGSAAAEHAGGDAARSALAGVTLEIVNGTADAGLGEYVAEALRQEGAAITGLASQVPQARSVIRYRAGFREQALAVSRRFANPPALEADERTDTGAGGANLRLVLGKNILDVTPAAASAQ